MKRGGGGDLTGDGFEALLALLGPDRETAGERYETIRRKLIRLFEWRGCEGAEDLADETLDRVARRVAEGTEIKSGDPYGYCCGVAHLVYKEDLRRASRERRVRDSSEWEPPIYVPDELEEPSNQRLDCLRHCLAKVPQDQRDLLLQYHQGENNIRNRKALATKLGIPLNALRIRVHRTRRKVEACVHDCLKPGPMLSR